jgi:hypothetical protein
MRFTASLMLQEIKNKIIFGADYGVIILRSREIHNRESGANPELYP